MTYTVTLVGAPTADWPDGWFIRSAASSRIEALAMAQNATLDAHHRSEFVTHEVHDDTGRLVASFTSGCSGER